MVDLERLLELGNIQKLNDKIKRYKEMKAKKPEEYVREAQKFGDDPIRIWESLHRSISKDQTEFANKRMPLQNRIQRLQARSEQLKKGQPLPRFSQKKPS